MEKKKNRWSLALALGLLLSLATGCGDDEKDEWQTFPGKWEDAEHLKGWLRGILPEEANVIVTQTDCDTPGIFLRIEEMPTRENWKDSLVYCHNDWLTPYKDQPGKKLRIQMLFYVDSYRQSLCSMPDSTVHCVSLKADFKELN